MTTNKKINYEHLIIAAYFCLYITCALILVIFQPFGDPPDESVRHVISQYILEHGKLPNGYEESIRIPSYGFSYAFQPILPYIIQAGVMAIVNLFHPPAEMLFYSARMVNLVFGLIMALFVLLLSKKWFQDKRMQYLFSFLVVFLPENLFMHTYINTDSCCLMSIAIMLYGLTRGIEDRFKISSCVILSVGIILCAMSYYNAYGFILSCILMFIAYFVSYANRKLHFDWKPFLQKGIFISVIVLAGIGWWFIRSYILYDGDFLGLKAREHCASLYAIPHAHPDTRVTYASQGISVWEMLRTSNFIISTTYSFICVMGPMQIVSNPWVYRFFKLLFIGGILSCALIPSRATGTGKGVYAKQTVFRFFFHCNMIFCILMPCILSIIYSHNTDYQPQGRYILPIVIPFAYYTIRGVEKAWGLFRILMQKLTQKKPIKDTIYDRIYTGLSAMSIVCIALSMLVTIFGYVLPYYGVY